MGQFLVRKTGDPGESGYYNSNPVQCVVYEATPSEARTVGAIKLQVAPEQVEVVSLGDMPSDGGWTPGEIRR